MDRNLRIRMLLEAGDRVSKPLRDIAGGSSRAAGALKDARERLDEIRRAQAAINGFRELKTGLRTTEAALDGANAKVAELARAMAATDTPTKKMAADFERAKREAGGLARTHDEQSAGLQQLRDRLRDAGVATGDLVAHERRLRGEAERTTREIGDQEQAVDRAADRSRRMAAGRERFGRIQGMAGNMAAGGASGIATGIAAAAPVLSSLQDAAAYESVMTDIAQKANLSRDASREMGLGLLAAAKAANQMPDALQQGVDTLAGFGLDPRKAVAMMKPIGRASTAYKAEIADLSAASFAAYDNLKVPLKQTGKLLDVLAFGGKEGAFEIKDMAGQFPALTAAYQGLGQTGVKAAADLTAAAQIARKGAGDSATAGNNLLNLLNKISAQDTNKNFKKFGIDLPDALKKAAREGKGPIEAITEMTAKALNGDNSKLSYLFGDAQVQAMMRPLLANMSEYRRIRDGALAATGTVDRDFAERMKDSAERAKQLQIQGASLSVVLGTQLKPVADDLSERAAKLAERFGNWASANPKLAKGIMLAAAGTALLMIVLGGLAIAAAGVFGPIALLGAAAGFLGIGMLPLLGITAGVVLGIGLLAGAAYLLYANWAKVDVLLTNVFTGVVNMFKWLGKNLMLGLLAFIVPGPFVVRVVAMARAAVKAFKSVLGIHSPSRVFAGLGGYMMEGLSNGIEDGETAPVRRIGALSRELAAAMAIGAATPAMAVAGGVGGTGAAGAGSGASSALAPPAVTFNIYGAPGQSPENIAKAVKAAFADHLRSQAAAARSSYTDTPDTI